MDEVEHDILTYHYWGLSNPPSQRLRLITQLQGFLILNNIMQKPNSVVILFIHFFKKICKRRHFSLSLQKLRTKHRCGAWKLKRLWTWQLVTQYLLQILGYHVSFTCYNWILTACSSPLRVFIVSLMYIIMSMYIVCFSFSCHLHPNQSTEKWRHQIFKNQNFVIF